MGVIVTLNITSGASANTGAATAGKTYTHWQATDSAGTLKRNNPSLLATARAVGVGGMLNLADLAFALLFGKPSIFTVNVDDTCTTAYPHGMVDGDIVTLTNSGGALPAGLSAATVYHVDALTATTFKLYTDAGLTSVANITGTGTGTQYLVHQGEISDATLLAMCVEGSSTFADTDKIIFGTDALMTDSTNIAAFDDDDWNAPAIY